MAYSRFGQIRVKYADCFVFSEHAFKYISPDEAQHAISFGTYMNVPPEVVGELHS